MTSVTSTPTFSLAYLEAVRDVKYQIVAAFSFMVWDFILTIEEEMKYVWRMRRCMFKWLYFYYRYFLLALQIFHLAIAPSLSSGRTPDSLCIVWRRYVVFIAQLSFSMIDIILAARVYALFNRSRKIGVFLGSLVLLVSGLTVVHIAKCATADYFEACILLSPQGGIAKVHTSVIIIVQSTIMGMVIFKHSVGVRLGWGRTPLLSLLVRDATSNYITVFLLCGIALTSFGLDNQRMVAIFYWAISLFSVIGCRLILDMEHFAKKYLVDEEILLTSHINIIL